MSLNSLDGGLNSSFTSKSRIIFFSLLLIGLMMIFSTGTAHAESTGSVMYVNGSNGSDSNNGYSWSTAKLTIGNATGAVNDGGTVNIANGTYTGTGNTNITISKNMTINGVNEGKHHN